MMRRVAIGRDGIALSVVGFGTGGLLRVAGRRARQNLLAAALDNGITHFDTAPVYGLGESERALGEFLRGRRAAVTLTTKFGLEVSRSARRLSGLQGLARRVVSLAPGLRTRLARRAGVLRAPPAFALDKVRDSLDRSLRALGTDCIDLFLAHECSADALPGEELGDFLAQARRAGKIREFGIASRFDRTVEVARMRPELSRVLQFESDALVANQPVARTFVAASIITHGAVAGSIERWRALGAADLADESHAAALLLRAAVLANPHGAVLMQSGSAARIAGNVRAALSSAFDERALILLQRMRGASA